jgi:hypothetical protein
MKGALAPNMGKFSIIVIAALFVCQVVGSICPMGLMAPVALAAPVAVHHLHTDHAHAAHVMAKGGMCPESITSSSAPSDTPAIHTLSLPLNISSLRVHGFVSVTRERDAPHESLGLPLFIRLSTFRI